MVNRHMTEVYDRLVDAGPADYYAATTTITTTSGIIPYPLEVDFRNLVYVYVRESTDERRPLRDMPNGARGRYKAPTGSWTLDVEYIPVAPTLDDDADTFDGVSGWEELIVNLVARDVMTKRQDDPSVPMSNIMRLESRITQRSRSRDKGAPKRVTDLDEVQATPFPNGWTGSSRLACYRLRAGNLELFEPLWGLPA
ncbi:MAG: hypothetical protein ACRCU1_11560 [Alsobacter sp.]